MNAEFKLAWTDGAIEQLVKRLYAVRREWDASGFPGSPTFVLPARNRDARYEFEQALLEYFANKYGIIASMAHVDMKSNAPGSSLIHFPTARVTLCLMDV